MRVFSNDYISGDPNANKVSVRNHLKINEIQAFSKPIVSLVYSIICACVCVGSAVGMKFRG